MGSLTQTPQTGRVGMCNTRGLNIGSRATENDLRRSPSPGPSTSSSRSTGPSTSSGRSMVPSTSSNQSVSSDDSDSTIEEEGSSPPHFGRNAAAVMKKRKLMDARCFRAIFSGGCYTKKIKLVHDNVDPKHQEAAKDSVSHQPVSPSSGGIGTIPSPACGNHNSSLPGDRDPMHGLSEMSPYGSCNLNRSSPSERLDKKSDNNFHTDDRHIKDNAMNNDDLPCEIALPGVDISKKSLLPNDSSDTRVDEKVISVGSCHDTGNDIGTSKTVGSDSGKNPLSSGIEKDEIVRSSRVSSDPILPLPVRSSKLNTDSCNGFGIGAASLSSHGKTSHVVRIKKVVNQRNSDSELEEGEIRETPQKSRCHISEGIGIPPKGPDLQAELQSEHCNTKAESVSEQKSLVERTVRERTRKLLAEQMLEKDRFKKLMDLEEVTMKEATEKDREMFVAHRSKQRRKLINLQVLARNKEKEMHCKWLEDASNGNLSKSFDSIPLPSSGFSPEDFMSSSNISVCGAHSSHVSEQERDQGCELGKSSGMSPDQHLETKNGDLPSNTINEIDNEVNKARIMQSKGATAEIEKRAQTNSKPCHQISTDCRQGTPSPSDGSSQISCSGFIRQIPNHETTTCGNDTQDTSQLKEILSLEQSSLGPSSIKARDSMVESTKALLPCMESVGPETAIGDGSCKDLLLSSSELTKPAFTKIVEKHPSNMPDELRGSQELSLSESLGASMPESIKLPSEDIKVGAEKIPGFDSVEVPIHEPTYDLPASQDRISSTYENRQEESGSQNLIAPNHETTTCDNDTQDTSQLKEILSLEQPSLGPSSIKARDSTVESTKALPCIESEGPEITIGDGSCKDLLLSSSELTKPAFTKIIEKHPSNMHDELCGAQKQSLSESLGASMPESIKLPSEDIKVVAEKIPGSDSVEVPIHEPTYDLPSSQDRISSTYENQQEESGSQNLIAPKSSQLFEDNFSVSDVMENVESVENSLASRVSPSECDDKVHLEKSQNSAVLSGMESNQETTVTEKSSETLSVANKVSDNSKLGSPDSLACNFPFTNDGPSILHEKFITLNLGGNVSDPDLCVPTSTQLGHPLFSSQPAGGSLPHHVQKEEAIISVSLQVHTLQQIQSIPLSNENPVVSAALDSESPSSHPFPVTSFDATPYDDDAMVWNSCHRASSSDSLSFATWVQSDASAAGQADPSAPRTITENRISSLPISDPEACSSNYVNLQVQSSSSGYIHSGLSDSPAVAIITPSEHLQGSHCYCARDGLSTNNAMASNADQPWLPSFVHTSNIPHAAVQADPSVPRIITENQISSLPISDPEACSSNSVNLLVQSSTSGHIHSGLSGSPAVVTPSEHLQGNHCYSARDGLATNNAMASNADQPQLPSFVHTSNIPHAEHSGDLAPAVTSQVNEQTSSDTGRVPGYDRNSNGLQVSTGGCSQPYVMTAQLPFRGILADPFANELSRILLEKDLVIKMCNDQKAKLKSEYDIEVEKVMKKYEILLQKAAAVFSERNGKLDIIYEHIKKNQLLANCCRSEMVGYDKSMEIITSAQGESSGFREQCGSTMDSASGAAAARKSANSNPLSDSGTIVSQGQSQSTTVFPASAQGSREQFGSGFIPASNVAVPVSATCLYDTTRLSQAQLQGSSAYPVTTSGSLTSNSRRNFAPGMTSAPVMGTLSTLASNNLGGRRVLPPLASVPSAGGVRHPLPSSVTSTATRVISTALNTNPVSSPTWRQQFEPCATSAFSGQTVPVSISTYPGSNLAMLTQVQSQSTTPSPAAASLPLPGLRIRTNQSSSTLMPNSSVPPIGSVAHPVISNPIRAPPPHLRYGPGMPVPRSMAQ